MYEQTPDPSPSLEPNAEALGHTPPSLDGSLEVPPPTEMQKLDRAVISYWRVHSFIGSVVLLALLGVVGSVVVANHFHVWPWVAAAWSFIFLLRFLLFLWHPPRSYRAWSYRVDDRVLETRRGIFIQVITLLPLSRLQHVDLERGPLERSFGLATLLLHTAGTQHATIAIPGLEAHRAAQLRDQLAAAGGDDGV